MKSVERKKLASIMPKTEITFEIETLVYNLFSATVLQCNGDINMTIEQLFRDYVEKKMKAKEPKYPLPGRRDENPRGEYKAINRLDGWIRRQSHPYHIIKAYFILEDEEGYVSYDDMRRLCSEGDLYVPNFAACFTSMTSEAGNSYGKVFDRFRDDVRIWGEVSDYIYNNKNRFLRKR